MNRRERRRAAAQARHNKFVTDYVQHLPEVGADAIGRPGCVVHAVYYQTTGAAFTMALASVTAGRSSNSTPSPSAHNQVSDQPPAGGAA